MDLRTLPNPSSSRVPVRSLLNNEEYHTAPMARANTSLPTLNQIGLAPYLAFVHPSMPSGDELHATGRDSYPAFASAPSSTMVAPASAPALPRPQSKAAGSSQAPTSKRASSPARAAPPASPLSRPIAPGEPSPSKAASKTRTKAPPTTPSANTSPPGTPEGNGGVPRYMVDAVKDRLFQDRPRTLQRLTPSQKRILEESFASEPYPSASAYRVLSSLAELPVGKIQVWFQNKRAQSKKKSKRKGEYRIHYVNFTRDGQQMSSPTPSTPESVIQHTRCTFTASTTTTTTRATYVVLPS